MKFNFIIGLAVLLAYQMVAPMTALAQTSHKDLKIFAEKFRQDYREKVDHQAGAPVELAEIRNIKIFAENPNREIPLRVYIPQAPEQSDKPPFFLFIHGGGFIAGDLETHEALARAIAKGSGCIVVAVDYRLAPENPFPAGLEDVYAALRWLYEKGSSELGGEVNKIVVGGDSAGGNLAAALAILSRDRQGPPLAGQWLMYPTLSNKMDTESWANLGEKYFPTREIISTIIEAYVPEGRSPYEPFIAPLWNEDLKNLPPALVQVGQLDPLSDESRDYALKLRASGNVADFQIYQDFQHGFLQFYQDQENFPRAEATLEYGLKWLRDLP